MMLLLLVLGFVIIIIQDFRERAISWWTVPWVFLCGAYSAWSNELWEPWFLGFNSLFVGIQLLGVSLYFSIKHRAWTNITQQYLGLGDVLFFFALTPLFAPVHFCCFFVGSLLVILLGAGIYHLLIKNIKTIPLAGAMSISWLAYQTVLYYDNSSSYDDWSLLILFYG